MRRLEIEFVVWQRVPWYGLSFLAGSMLIAIAVGGQWWSLHREQQALRERVATAEQARLARQHAQAERDAAARPQVERREREQKAVLAAVRYPWPMVFNEVERPAVEHLAVLSFAHDRATRTGRVTVEALDVATVVRYVQALNEGNSGTPWYIESYRLQPQNVPPTVVAQVVSK